MVNRKRTPRSFTLPDDFVRDLQHAAKIREISASALIEEWCSAQLRIDAYINRLLNQPVLNYEDEADAKCHEDLREFVDAYVNARDPDDVAAAGEELQEFLARATADGRLSEW